MYGKLSKDYVAILQRDKLKPGEMKWFISSHILV